VTGWVIWIQTQIRGRLPVGLIRSVVTIYRYDRITDAIDPEQTYNRPYE